MQEYFPSQRREEQRASYEKPTPKRVTACSGCSGTGLTEPRPDSSEFSPARRQETCPVCAGEGKSPITWERSIGLWYGYGDDGSMWTVSLPTMDSLTWEAEGPDEFHGSGARTGAVARTACEVEYRKRAERLAQTPQARLRALVEQWQSTTPSGDMADPETVGYNNGRADAREGCAEELSALIAEVYGDGQ